MQIHHKIFDDVKLNLLRKNIEQFVPLTDGEFENVIAHFSFKEIKKHQFLLLEGDPCYHDYFVLNGALRQYYIHQTKEHNVQFAFENWWISDWTSLLEGTSSQYYIEALENTEVLQIEKDSLDKLFREVPKFEKFYRISFQRSFAALQRRISSMQKSGEECYKDFARLYGHFETRISQTHIASYLGLSPESLSRIKSQTLIKTKS